MLGAEWCPACVKLKNSIMPQVAQTGRLTGIELAYVDVDKEPALARQLVKGGSIPQLVRFEKGSNGWESKYMIGAQSPDQSSPVHLRHGREDAREETVSLRLGAITSTLGLED